MSSDHERTASLMTPGKLAQMKPQAAASPAAWLDQMASDAGHLHLRRIAELHGTLDAQARARAPVSAAPQLQAVLGALGALDYKLLQPKGWLARATGKAKNAGAEFAAQVDAVVAALAPLREQANAVQQGQQGQAGAAERTLVEFEVEWRAIDKIIDQGARWLQDMRNQLKTRQAAAPDEAGQRQIREDAARCEILVARLKLLRAVSSAAQAAQKELQATGTRRAALAQALQKLAAREARAWQDSAAVLAASARETGSSSLSTESVQEAEAALRTALERALADTAQFQAQADALAQAMATLGQQLQSAG